MKERKGEREEEKGRKKGGRGAPTLFKLHPLT